MSTQPTSVFSSELAGLSQVIRSRHPLDADYYAADGHSISAQHLAATGNLAVSALAKGLTGSAVGTASETPSQSSDVGPSLSSGAAFAGGEHVASFSLDDGGTHAAAASPGELNALGFGSASSSVAIGSNTAASTTVAEGQGPAVAAPAPGLAPVSGGGARGGGANGDDGRLSGAHDTAATGSVATHGGGATVATGGAVPQGNDTSVITINVAGKDGNDGHDGPPDMTGLA